jgi:hypothetical protein
MGEFMRAFLLFILVLGTQTANAWEMNCVDSHFVPKVKADIRRLSDSERAHFGAGFGFEMSSIPRSGTGEAVLGEGVADRNESSSQDQIVFDLFQGAPYVRTPARANGRLVIFTPDPAQTEFSGYLTWQGTQLPVRCLVTP